MTENVIKGGERYPYDYIGDGVYASFDGYRIWLITGDGNNQRIALVPNVFASLLRYEKLLREYFE